jgi:hypothetical protein
VGQAYTDPVFGATIKRVSNALATPNADQGGYLTWIEDEYSTASAFNNDNSKFILLHQSYFGLYDGSTGLYIHDLPLEISSSSEPRWSRSDLVTIYYHLGNELKSYNISTGGINVVHTFSQYTSISGLGEMDISRDGDHFVFVGDNRYAFVYQISTGQAHTPLDMNGHAFDSVYITPNNNVIVSWIATGSTRYTGQELFDTNMNFLRQVGHADGHKHLTVDVNGQEVLIWTNSNDAQPIANCQNGIVKIVLATAAQTCLLQLDWSLAVHITAPDGNGSAYIDTEAPSNPAPGSAGWVAYTNEIVQVKLDGSGAIRWAQHRSRPLNSYNWQPKLTVSRDGTRLLYASDYDLQSIYGDPTDYGDTYLITMGASTSGGSGSGGSTTGNGSGSGSTGGGGSSGSGGGSGSSTAGQTIRLEQNNGAVQYSGSWFPNGASFNSGGSAVLAMDAGSIAKVTFRGTGVKWIGFSDPWSGIAQVYLDGVLIGSIDTYAATQAAQKVQYAVANLASGVHTLTISVTGQKNSSSGGAWVWVDAFDVTSAATSARSSPSSSGAPLQLEGPRTLARVRLP